MDPGGLGSRHFLRLRIDLTSRRVSVITVMVGAPAIATAFYLILNLSNTYAELSHASSAPLEQVLAAMWKD